MKKNYIQPASEFVVLGSSTDIAVDVDINNTSTRGSMSIDSNNKDWDDDIDWDDDTEE